MVVAGAAAINRLRRMRQKDPELEQMSTGASWLLLFEISWADQLLLVLTNAALPKRKYELTFHTGDAKHSGTDAMLHMSIIGTEGMTAPPMIISSKHKHFGTGVTKGFTIKDVDMGVIKGVALALDHTSSAHPGWKLSTLTILDLPRGTRYTLRFTDWITVPKKGEELQWKFYEVTVTEQIRDPSSDISDDDNDA
jgi:hypothetical protein